MTGPAASLAVELADRYAIERELGRGAGAAVYLAHDLRHGRRVALKVLHSALGAALGVERFQREIRTHARLQHPHILPLFDSGVAGGRLYYTMPFVEGGSLRDRLKREPRLPLPEVVQMGVEVASALTYAHSVGIIHRDLKPENILLSARGEALLTDFGIASALEEGTGPGRLTESGITLGTPAYMSPEQSAGDEPVDARSDLYSLATVMYEALAGTPPFTGSNARAILARRLVETPAPLRQLRTEVPPALDAAINRALARDPGDRFDSVAEFTGALAGESGAAGGEMARWGRRAARLGLTLTVLGGVLIGVYQLPLRRSYPPAGTPEQRMIAVLPFRNLGQPSDQYFADGLTEELTSRLASLSGLRVISRTSADQYRETAKSMKEIGAELGAGYVLEGSVRWEHPADGSGKVRVAPRLIAVSSDSKLWGQDYEVELTRVFEVQSDIAQRVTTALDVALLEPERTALAAGGTRSVEAHDFYLRGNDYLGRSNQEADLTNAARLFQQAVEADPGFAVAYAKLARCHTQIYWHYYDHTEARLSLARMALDSAVRLGPKLTETHMALGFFHYWAHLDYQNALREFEAAHGLQPSSSEILQAIGYVERRRGRWEASLERFLEALRYDPRSGVRNFDVGDNYFSLRRYPEADRYLERASILSPDWPNPWVYRAWLRLAWKGDLADARGLLARGLERIEPGRFVPSLHSGDRISASLFTADSAFWPVLDGVTLATYAGDTVRYHLIKAEAAAFRHRRTSERGHADSARVLLEARLRGNPDEAKLLGPVALAYSHLGRHVEAVRAGERAAESLPVTRDAVSGPFVLAYLARVYMDAGRQDPAVDLLERLAGMRSWITPAELRADPIWTPLRQHPRFRRLAGLP